MPSHRRVWNVSRRGGAHTYRRQVHMPSAGVRYVCGYNRREWKEVAYPVAFGLGGPVSTVERQEGRGHRERYWRRAQGMPFPPCGGLAWKVHSRNMSLSMPPPGPCSPARARWVPWLARFRVLSPGLESPRYNRVPSETDQWRNKANGTRACSPTKQANE